MDWDTGEQLDTGWGCASGMACGESPSKNNAPERVTDASAAYPDESVGKAPSESSQP